jgi:hypothetical protein
MDIKEFVRLFKDDKPNFNVRFVRTKKGARKIKELVDTKISEIAKVGEQAKGSLADLPNEFVATITSAEETTDEQYNVPLIAVGIDLEGTNYVISYKPLHAKKLVKALTDLKVDELKKGQKFKFQKVDFGIGFSRPIPIAVAE